jgi:hypothetical protein
VPRIGPAFDSMTLESPARGPFKRAPLVLLSYETGAPQCRLFHVADVPIVLETLHVADVPVALKVVHGLGGKAGWGRAVNNVKLVAGAKDYCAC